MDSSAERPQDSETPNPGHPSRRSTDPPTDPLPQLSEQATPEELLAHLQAGGGIPGGMDIQIVAEGLEGALGLGPDDEPVEAKPPTAAPQPKPPAQTQLPAEPEVLAPPPSQTELLAEIDGGGALEESGERVNRPEAVMESLSATSMAPRHQLEAWLATMVHSGASDLILRANGRPSSRIDGRVGFLPGRVPGPGALIEVLEGVVGPKRMEEWRETGSCDAALHLDGLGRFRLNAYRQMGEPALVLRRIAEDPPQLQNLDLPTVELQKIAMRKRGLVLVTGIAGSGKSTTLSGLIEHMNRNMQRHVITLEDPVEVLFTEDRCVISQREVGVDCSSFHEGLRHALRQSPDVILIGEMRDRETVAAALDASETGHLVLSTMHTVNAAQTLDRILGFFPSEQHGQVRMRLADNMAAVLSQRLIPRAMGTGMVPAFELMTSTPRIRELMEEGSTGEVQRTIESSGESGLISFNQALRRLVELKKIELKDALAASDRPEELILALRGITQSSERIKPGPTGEPPAPGSGGGNLRLAGS